MMKITAPAKLDSEETDADDAIIWRREVLLLFKDNVDRYSKARLEYAVLYSL